MSADEGEGVSSVEGEEVNSVDEGVEVSSVEGEEVSSDEEDDDRWFDIYSMIYSNTNELRDVFHDVTPMKQDDGPEPVCTIDYSPEFTRAYDYMRALLHNKENDSERALKLSGLCVKLNPANYTIWHFRRQCLQEQINKAANNNKRIRKIIQNDLRLASAFGGSNPKNYQIWYHRRALIEIMIHHDPHPQSQPQQESSSLFTTDFYLKEIAYISGVLNVDSKNYHAWSHRQWLVMQMSNQYNDTNNEHSEEEVWIPELQYANDLICKDHRNNSAWNYRWFVSHHGGKCRKDDDNDDAPYVLPLDIAKKEADYAIQGANIDPFNESPWRYLIGIVKEQLLHNNSDPTQINQFLDEYYQRTWEEVRNETLASKRGDFDDCPNLLSAVVDLLEFKGDKESLEMAIEHAQKLAHEYDPIRKKYWLFRIDELKSNCSVVEQH